MYRFLKKNNLQILRFILVGSLATGINFLVYTYTYQINNNITFASILGYTTGLLISFIFAKIWVFKKKSKMKIVKSFSIFSLIYLLGGIEMSLIIIFLNDLMNNHKISWFFGAFIGFLNNYLGTKYLLFKK